MSPQEAADAVAREKNLARADIDHCKELIQSEAFNKYYVRQLTQKQTALLEKILRDETISKDEREVLRRLWLFLDEIISVPRAHLAAAIRTLGG